MTKVKRTVSVTQADLDTGKPRQACHCPIAKATKRTFPEYPYVAVNGKDFLFSTHIDEGPNEILTRVGNIPQSVADFINVFEADPSKAQLFSFELEVEIP